MVRAASLAALSSLVFAACGGATSAPIDNSNTSGGASSSSGSTSSSGASSSSSSSSGASSGSSGGVIDSGVARDAGGAGSNPGFVTCGSLTCKTNGGGPAIEEQYCCLDKNGVGACKQGPVTACEGLRILCDEAADCVDEENVCCAEAGLSSGPGGDRIQTRCLPTCVTGAPRTQICKTDAECKDSGGKCQAFACDGYPPSFRFCSRPLDCK